MDKHEQAVMRGDAAARILNDPVFLGSFTAIRDAYLREWEDMPTSESESARDIHRRLKCLADVKTALQAHITTGKMAQRELSMREKITNSANRAVRTLTQR